MKYLCLIFQDEQKVKGMTEDEYNTVCQHALIYEEELREGGHLLVAEPLQPVNTAATLRFQRNGELSITDGPFAETKEQLAGFFLIEARDLNDAIRIASNIPPARLGCVEVRPLRDLPRMKES